MSSDASRALTRARNASRRSPRACRRYWLLGFVHIPIVRYYANTDGTLAPEVATEQTLFGLQLFSASTTVQACMPCIACRRE